MESAQVHHMFLINTASIVAPIEERECLVVVTAKRTWAEPHMPLRGWRNKDKKRYTVGTMAFYTLKAAERAKLGRLMEIARSSWASRKLFAYPMVVRQLTLYKETGSFEEPNKCPKPQQ